MDDKRIIDGYEVLHAIRIDGAEQIASEKDHHYRLYCGERVSGLGLENCAGDSVSRQSSWCGVATVICLRTASSGFVNYSSSAEQSDFCVAN